MHSFITLRSSFSSHLLKKTLFRGFFLAFIGIIILILPTIFFPHLIKQWGALIFLLSLSFITLGLLPYRKLLRKQMNPDEIIITDTEELIFISKGKKIFTLPFQIIKEISYVDHLNDYGICLKLDSDCVSSLNIERSKEFAKLQNKEWVGNKKLGNKMIFLPHFNRHAFEEISNILEC